MGAFVQEENRKRILKALHAQCEESLAGDVAKYSVCLNLCLKGQSLQARIHCRKLIPISYSVWIWTRVKKKGLQSINQISDG